MASLVLFMPKRKVVGWMAGLKVPVFTPTLPSTRGLGAV